MHVENKQRETYVPAMGNRTYMEKEKNSWELAQLN